VDGPTSPRTVLPLLLRLLPTVHRLPQLLPPAPRQLLATALLPPPRLLLPAPLPLLPTAPLHLPRLLLPAPLPLLPTAPLHLPRLPPPATVPLPLPQLPPPAMVPLPLQLPPRAPRLLLPRTVLHLLLRLLPPRAPRLFTTLTTALLALTPPVLTNASENSLVVASTVLFKLFPARPVPPVTPTLARVLASVDLLVLLTPLATMYATPTMETSNATTVNWVAASTMLSF